MRDLVQDLLRHHEGRELTPYTDTVGKITIGVGRNLTDKGLSEEEVEYLFGNDIQDVYSELNYTLPWWSDMSDVRRAVLVDMCFNMGMPRLTKFKKALAAMKSEEWDIAAAEMLDSVWAKQVKGRALELASMMKKNTWPEWMV